MALTQKSKGGTRVANIDAGWIKKLLPIYHDPCTLKIIHGGRASGKSTCVAQTLLLYGKQWPIRVLCLREYGKNNYKSMYQTLTDEIYALGLGEFYNMQSKETIVGQPVKPDQFIGHPIRQTEFIFRGMGLDPEGLKSMQKISACWIEEAQNMTKHQWEQIEPTIRQPFPDGRLAETFITFNPAYADNFVWEHFVIREQPDSMVIQCNYLDNPWAPPNSVKSALRMKESNYSDYENVWLGVPKQNFVGSVYEDFLADAYAQNRIGEVPYDPNYSVELYFDVGQRDMTAVWAVQRCDGYINVIDYYENRRKPASHFLDIMSHRGYPVTKWVLPWDGNAHAGPMQLSWEDVFRKAGKSVRRLRYRSVEDGIQCAREIFSTCHFDADRCKQGLNCLRHYRYAEHKDGIKISSKPVHDVYSNGADAWRYCAIGMKFREVKPFPRYVDPTAHLRGHPDSWMAAL